MLGLGADGAPPVVQLRTPPPSMMGLPSLPASLEGYSYIIMKLGPLQLTRKGLSVASTSASLTFSVSFLFIAFLSIQLKILRCSPQLFFCFTFLFLNCSFLNHSHNIHQNHSSSYHCHFLSPIPFLHCLPRVSYLRHHPVKCNYEIDLFMQT